jgi:hypothetical protein
MAPESQDKETNTVVLIAVITGTGYRTGTSVRKKAPEKGHCSFNWSEKESQGLQYILFWHDVEK